MEKDDLNIYRQAIEYARENRENSPLVNSENLPIPITPASQNRKAYNRDINDEENTEVDFDADLSFFCCELCHQWKTKNNIFLVETNEAEIYNQDDGMEYKTLKRDIKSWCAHCIIDILDKCNNDDSKEKIALVNEEISKIKDEKQKIKRISD